MIRKSKVLSVGLGQINPTVGDFAENTRKICSYIEMSELRGMDIVIFPELAISGYPVWDLANHKRFLEKNLEALQSVVSFTRKKHVTVVLGFIDQAPGEKKKTYNALAVIHGGRLICKQYKALLPTYDVFLEEIFFKPGTKHHTFSLRGIRIGLSICEDIWDDRYPVKPAKILAEQGAKVLINISASPYFKEAPEARRKVVAARAKKYGFWVIYVNQVGGQDDLIFDGRSFVSDPAGRVRFQAEAFREGLFQFSLDLNPKKSLQAILRKDSVDGEVYRALVLGLSDYAKKNGFRKVAIGLSGGIDSALVAAIACDALGPEAVIGVAMPGPFSSPQSLRDAKALAKALGMEFRVKSISKQYQKFIRASAQEKRRRGVKSTETKSISLAMENLQARFRGLTLMYLSNDEGALLLTTGNKSELAMGYSTLYGDMCGGISVIGDVYKTDVYRLAQYRNSISKVIPEATIKRAPTAELRPNQKDQDSLPPYAVLDEILYLYIEKNKSFPEICQQLSRKRISREVIGRVLRSVDRNEYKRRQLPPSLRITEKAWFGRRMPITNRFKE